MPLTKGRVMCTLCGETDPEKMLRNRKRLSGFHPRCKPCQNKYSAEWREKNRERIRLRSRVTHMARKYGLSEDEALTVLTGLVTCSICGLSGPFGRGFAIDHDHETGLTRGILCVKCNLGLGGFKDDPKLLQRAIKYLENPSAFE